MTDHGPAPLTLTTLRHFRKEMGMPRFDPCEIQALLTLDGVLLAPGEMK